MIVMSCMMIILAATHGFLAGGVDFYNRSIQSLEVQQATLVGLSKICDELENSNFDKIFVPPAPDNDAVVFPSIMGVDGNVQTNDKGILLWRAIVCFVQTTQPDGRVLIVRKADAHPDVDYPPDPLTIASGPRNIAYFAPLEAAAVMARNVAVPAAGDPPAFEIVKGTDRLTITLKVEFSTTSKDSMKVQSYVFPKN
jgi:hypothetical protein